jgi:hypothetical protein
VARPHTGSADEPREGRALLSGRSGGSRTARRLASAGDPAARLDASLRSGAGPHPGGALDGSGRGHGTCVCRLPGACGVDAARSLPHRARGRGARTRRIRLPPAGAGARALAAGRAPGPGRTPGALPGATRAGCRKRLLDDRPAARGRAVRKPWLPRGPARGWDSRRTHVSLGLRAAVRRDGAHVSRRRGDG